MKTKIGEYKGILVIDGRPATWVIRATAAQRVEAFLRVMGLWTGARLATTRTERLLETINHERTV